MHRSHYGTIFSREMHETTKKVGPHDRNSVYNGGIQRAGVRRLIGGNNRAAIGLKSASGEEALSVFHQGRKT
jgi:hypothetical protein